MCEIVVSYRLLSDNRLNPKWQKNLKYVVKMCVLQIEFMYAALLKFRKDF